MNRDYLLLDLKKNVAMPIPRSSRTLGMVIGLGSSVPRKVLPPWNFHFHEKGRPGERAGTAGCTRTRHLLSFNRYHG